MPINDDKQRLNVIADEYISVTVDASDLTLASVEPLRNLISRYGRPVIARAFADYQQSSTSDLAVQLYQMGFSLVHCPTWPNGDGFPKPVVGDVLAQDLRDQLEEVEDVGTFLLVATSRDYIAVVNALKRHGYRVVVAAEEVKVCRELRQCADEFVLLPPTRPERVTEGTRSRRSIEAPRLDRPADTARPERAVEPVRAEPVRAEPVRAERVADPGRSASEAIRTRLRRAPAMPADRPAEAARAESQDQVRLPSDAEVLAEVKRIVAAEGICTPRRLARALCPVDRTPTGELRSRIANRIQSLIDSGKLQRERLVVGGTSVETILAHEERDAQPSVSSETASVPVVEAVPVVSNVEAEVAAVLEASASEEGAPGDGVSKPAEQPSGARGQRSRLPARDLDALVESVLRAPELTAGMLNRDLEQQMESPVVPQDTASTGSEKPKRTRSRRRPSSKAAVAETNGAS